MSILHRGHSIDASYQVLVHLAKRFQRRRLKCEKQTDDRRLTPSDGKSSYCLWQGLLNSILKCEYILVMYRINMLHYISISYFSKGDNYKSYLSFNRGKYFFRNQAIRNKSCLWRPCLLTDRDKMSNLYREPSIDASYQVPVPFGRGVSEEKIKM